MSAHLGTQSSRLPPLSRGETEARRGKGASEFCEDLVLPFLPRRSPAASSIHLSTILPLFLPSSLPLIRSSNPASPVGLLCSRLRGFVGLSLKVKEVGARSLLREWLA